MKRRLMAWAPTAALLLAACAMNGAGPFAASNKPHGTIRLNGIALSGRLLPVQLWSVDGQRLTAGHEEATFALDPGPHELTFRLPGAINRGHVPGPFAGREWQRTNDTLKLDVRAGETYYIAARSQGNGAWDAVVWKTGSTRP